LLLLLAAWVLHAVASRLEAYAASPYPLAPTLSYEAFRRHGLGAAQDRQDHLDLAIVPVEFPFRRGQTVASVLAGLGLEAREAGAVIEELAQFADLRKVRPADHYAALYRRGADLHGFELMLAGRGRVRAEREEGGWIGTWHPFSRTTEVRRIVGALEGFLEGAIVRAGGQVSVAYAMAEVLQWDVDFNRDLRVGDRFEVLYEEIYLDGNPFGAGDILALTFVNRGKKLEAYRFVDPPGYYDGEGRPLRKMFLRSPLRYSRVTSRFSRSRFHPILKRYRPHYGVDYGAPTGTPVRVTANGVVSFAGRDRGGGNMIKVRHPNDYETAYLHLSRFASGIRPGRRVEQGETIGYVGSTGLSTAPHLDYRVQHRGRWIDPLSLKSEPAEPIPESRLGDFLAWRDRLRGSLYEDEPFPAGLRPLEATRVAAAESREESPRQMAGR
jgi:murein DD-endopeptidase MepM/ murein hydrolase activator NlpD